MGKGGIKTGNGEKATCSPAFSAGGALMSAPDKARTIEGRGDLPGMYPLLLDAVDAARFVRGES